MSEKMTEHEEHRRLMKTAITNQRRLARALRILIDGEKHSDFVRSFAVEGLDAVIDTEFP